MRRRRKKRRKGQLDQIRFCVTKLGSYYNGHWFRMALPQHVPFHCAQLINLLGSSLALQFNAKDKNNLDKGEDRHQQLLLSLP